MHKSKYSKVLNKALYRVEFKPKNLLEYFSRKAFMRPQVDINVAGSVLKYGICD